MEFEDYLLDKGWKPIIHTGYFEDTEFIPTSNIQWFGKSGQSVIGLSNNKVCIKKLSGICFEGIIKDKLELSKLIEQLEI